MRIDGLRRRLRRLELLMKVGECDACAETVARFLAERQDALGDVDDLNELNRRYAELNSRMEIPPCPECGNPRPRMSWKFWNQVRTSH
jgi:hypothetical protein